MKIIFYDTETSGLGINDRLYHLAYRIVEFTPGKWEIIKDFNEKFNISVTISAEATKVNGMTNADIAHLPFIKDSPKYKEILADFSIPDAIYVAHNALFDIGMLNKDDVKVPNVLCTKHVAKTYVASRVQNHRLQTLRDFFVIDLDAKAHDALGDVIVLEEVFKKLFHEVRFREMLNAKTAQDIIGHMLRVSKDGMLTSRFADERTQYQEAKERNGWQ